MDWKALVLWIVLCAVDVVVIIPFLKNYDKQLLAEEAAYEE